MKQLSEGTIKNRSVRRACADAIKHMFIQEEDFSFATSTLELAYSMVHVMEFTRMRAMEALFLLLEKVLKTSSNSMKVQISH